MKRVLILSAAVLFCGVPLRAQVTKQVEVTKAYVPEVSKAVKLPVAPDMTDTVRLRPEIDYTVTPLALATNLSTEPFRPASVTYWEFNRPRPFYLKVGAGAPLNSVLDLYASTQNSGTGYVVGYLNHAGDWAGIRNDFGVRPASWRMHNRLGAAAGRYLGRRVLEGKLDLTTRVYHNYAFDGAEAWCVRRESDGSESSYPFTKIANDRQHYTDAALRMHIGDDFTDLSRFNFDVELRGSYFLSALQRQPVYADWGVDRDDSAELSGGGGVRLARAFGLHAFEFRADFDGTWSSLLDYRSAQLLFGLHYACRHEKLRWSVGLDYVRDGMERDVVVGRDLSDSGKVYRESRTKHANRFLPAASIAYDPADGRFMLYAELTGRVRRNDMRTLSRLNPYVGPASVVPNTEEHRVAGGIKGAAGHGRFSYKLYVGYSHEKNALQWVARFMPNNLSDERSDAGYMSFYAPYAMTLKDLSLNAEFAWRPSSRFTFDGEVHAHSFKGARDVRYKNNEPYTLAYGRPQLTARLRGEYRARKVSLEVEAELQSVRHWTIYRRTYERIAEWQPDFELNIGPRPIVELYDYEVPVTVDLAARFNWFLSRKATLFVEGRNLCDAKLYDWAYYRDYGVGFTVGVKLQF